MPISKEVREEFYGEEWDSVIRPKVLKRARHCCERCLKPDRVKVYVTYRDGLQYWIKQGPTGKLWRNEFGEMEIANPPGKHHELELITVVLSVIHFNHVRGDDRLQNLKAYCQRCHLLHDKDQHADTRKDRKDSARPLLAVLCGPQLVPPRPPQPSAAQAATMVSPPAANDLPEPMPVASPGDCKCEACGGTGQIPRQVSA